MRLPADAVASLRQSSLLGEKFVELAAPDTDANARARLADGAVITADRTNRHTEVEEVFGALSLLLNGGGIGQLRTINQELTNVLTGNEPQIRAFLSNVDELVTDLDAPPRRHHRRARRAEPRSSATLAGPPATRSRARSPTSPRACGR